jgi:hypothetical protein
MTIFPFNLLFTAGSSSGNRKPCGDINLFLAGLSKVADRVENLHYRFGEAQDPDGFVQLWRGTDHWIQIHRLWTRKPNRGDGSRILQTLCTLADEHDIGIRLKVIPIGRKPYPLPRVALKHWYERFGFTGAGWKLQRLPATTDAQSGTSSQAWR